MPGHLTIPRRLSQGFSLIEALVTLVIIGLGVLAAASLQIGARKGQQEAAQRTAASSLVQDLVERMNANPAGRDTYITALAANPSNDTGGLPAGPACQNGSCTPPMVATADLGRWWGGLTGTNVTDNSDATPLLDEPTVCLCLRPGTTGDYLLTLAWRGAGPAGSFAAQSDDGIKAGLSCGDTEQGIYDDPDNNAPDVSLRRTEVVRYVFPDATPVLVTAPPAAPACAQ